MNYTLTEDEYYALDDVRAQLNLVASLLTAKGANAGLMDESDLCAFLSAQVDGMKTVLTASDERCIPMPTPVPANPVHVVDIGLLVDMVRAASGKDLGQERMREVNDSLLELGCVDAHVGRLFKAYNNALRRAGWVVVTTFKDGQPSVHYERTPSVAGTPSTSATEPNGVAKNPGMRKRDKLARATAAGVAA